MSAGYRPITNYLHTTVEYPLRVSSQGRYILKGMFYEISDLQDITTAISDPLGNRPLFTLKVFDWTIPPESRCYRPDGPNKLRSLHQLFVEAEDPSEYTFAMNTLGSYEHWDALTQCAFFQPFLKKMRRVLEIRLDAKTVQAAKEAMTNGGGNVALQAAKWLNSRVVKTPKRGRPSQEEVDGELKKQVEESKILSDDLTRISSTDRNATKGR